jgi:hypothetical protein
MKKILNEYTEEKAREQQEEGNNQWNILIC